MEGPSLVILKEQVEFLRGQPVIDAHGNANIDFTRLIGKKIHAIETFGKHFLMVFPDFFVRVHFLMFGSYRLDDRKDRETRLTLRLKANELNFYASAVSLIEGSPGDIYDWSVDVMSEKWDPKKARKRLKGLPEMNVGDALLDQTIFAGVGNIIKNELLYRLKIHPYCTIGALPPRKLTSLVYEARNYSFDFFEWKKIFALRKHWAIYKKKKCGRCGVPVLLERTGKTPRRTFFCEGCQVLYS